MLNYHWFFWIPLIVNLFSFVASLSLFCWLCKLQGNYAKKLLARQLWHLALSDVITSTSCIGFVTFLILGRFHVVTWNHAVDVGCRFIPVANASMLASLLFELHIAAATVLTIRRCYRAVRVLSNVLGIVWLFAVVGAVILVVSSSHISWNDQIQFCDNLRFEDTTDCIMAATVGLCVAIYIAGALWAWCHTTGSTQRHLQRMAGSFMGAALVTSVPYLVFLLLNLATPINEVNIVAGIVAVSFLLSNGLVNAAAYALQSRFVRQMQRRGRLLAGSYRHRRHAPSHVASWRVAFSNEDDVVTVSGVTREAQSRAERETVTLEAGQARQAREAGEAMQFSDAIQARHALAGDDVEPGQTHADDDFEPELHFLTCFDVDAASAHEVELR